MFKSLLGIMSDAAKIATAPIEIALDVTRAATKPIAEVAEELVEDVKGALDVEDGGNG